MGGGLLPRLTRQLLQTMLNVLLKTFLAKRVEGGSRSVAYGSVLLALESSFASAGCSR